MRYQQAAGAATYNNLQTQETNIHVLSGIRNPQTLQTCGRNPTPYTARTPGLPLSM